MLTFDRHILVTSVYLFLSYCCVVCDVLTYLLSLVALVSWFPILHRLLVIFFSWTTVNATIRKFRIGPSLSNRIGTSDSKSNRISKLRRSLILSAIFRCTCNGDLQTLICVLVARPRRCLTLSNPVP